MKDFLTLNFGIPLNMQMELMGYDNTIQARLKECEITELDVELVETWVLKFKCPYLITDELTQDEIININYDLVTEEKLIKLKTNDSYAVFVIKEINETENKFKEIIAYSREKMINKEVVLDKATIQIKSDDIETGEGVFDKLEKTVRGWKLKYLDSNAKIEHIDGIRANKYRYFDSVQMPWIDFLKDGFREAFDTLLLFDTYNKDIYCYDYKSYGIDTGFVINKKNIVNLASKKIDSKNMITKLYPSGSKLSSGNNKEGNLGIETVCPYGSYVLDYTYVRPKMSKDLQQALDVYDKEIQPLFVQWKTKNDEIVKLNIELDDLKNQRLQLNLKLNAKHSELGILLGDEKITKKDTSKIKPELDSLNSQLSSIESQIKSKEMIIKGKQNELASITNSMQIENIISNGQKIFNDALLDELDAYTYEGRLSNELHFKSESLYKWALDKVKEINKPDITFDLKECDFLDDVKGYTGFNQKMNLGDWMYVEDERLGKEKIRFIGYIYNPSTKELNLKFSNKDKRNEYKGTSGAIKKFNNTDRVFNIKKTNWDLASQQKDFVKDIRENGLNTALAKIYSQHNKNKIEINDSGIWLSNAENTDRMLIETADAIAISNDGLVTVKACITADGIIGDVIIGRILAGENLYISNKNNNFIIDQNGIRCDVNNFKVKTSNGDNTVTGLLEITSKELKTQFTDADKELDSTIRQTAEGLSVNLKDTKNNLQANIEATARSLTSKYQEADNKLSSNFEQTARSLTAQVNNVEDNVNSQIKMLDREISSKVSEGEVSSIIKQNSSSVRIAFNDICGGVTIDRNGLTVHDGYISADCIRGGTISGVHIEGNVFDGSDANLGDITCQQFRARGRADFYQDVVVKDTFHADYIGSYGDIAARGSLSVTGSKNCIQSTEHYGKLLINAYETAEYFFGDLGFGTTNKDGECVVYIDEKMQECINTNISYHTWIQPYEFPDYKYPIRKIERYLNCFIIKGIPNIEFSFHIMGKRKGFENVRLEEVESNNLLNNYINHSAIQAEIDNNKNIENILLERLVE